MPTARDRNAQQVLDSPNWPIIVVMRTELIIRTEYEKRQRIKLCILQQEKLAENLFLGLDFQKLYNDKLSKIKRTLSMF